MKEKFEMTNVYSNLPLEVQKVAELCSAPLCIVYLYLGSTEAGNGGIISCNGDIWYPEEAICSCYRKQSIKRYLHLENGNAPKWIKRQHNIKKYCENKGTRQADGYFTYEMLNADRMIKGSTKGINPDFNESIQMERFFSVGASSKGVNHAA